MSKTIEIGDKARVLLKDETFQSVMQEIKDTQVAVFLDTAATPEDREEAHVIVRALGHIEAVIRFRVTDAAFEQKQKDQHRGND